MTSLHDIIAQLVDSDEDENVRLFTTGGVVNVVWLSGDQPRSLRVEHHLVSKSAYEYDYMNNTPPFDEWRLFIKMATD